MNKAQVQAFLGGLGFGLMSEAPIGDGYSLPLASGMEVTAWGSKGWTLFDLRQDEYAEIRFTLQSRGTAYKFRSLAALQAHAGPTVAELERVSRNPDLLKCPKCRVRFVHAKEPVGAQKWKPFLSCEGMVVEGRGSKKGIVCDGTSTKLPAVVVYR